MLLGWTAQLQMLLHENIFGYSWPIRINQFPRLDWFLGLATSLIKEFTGDLLSGFQ